MANKTVYPYGTEGSLPSSIGIINDRTTGGVDKAWSAEQGKLLSQEVEQLAPKVNAVYSDLYIPGETEYIEITPEDADSTYENRYFSSTGQALSSQYYDIYCKQISEDETITYEIKAGNMGLFVSDSPDLSSAKTKIAHGVSSGTYEILAGKYLWWNVLRSNPSQILVNIESVGPDVLKNIVTDEDLQPIEASIANLTKLAQQITTTKTTLTKNASVGQFRAWIDVEISSPFRVSIELLSGKRTSTVDFYLNICYSDAPDTIISVRHNSLSFDECAYFSPSKQVSRIGVFSPVGFEEESQVKITVEVYSKLWEGIYSSSRKPWSGKRIVCFGDSITELLDGAYMSWPDHFARTTGAEVINLGLGGTCIKPRSYSAENTVDWAYSQVDILNAVKAVVGGDGSSAFSSYESGIQYIYSHVTQIIGERDNLLTILENARSLDLSKVDAIVLFAGINDWYLASYTKEEVFAALVELVQTISTVYPNVQIYYCNPMPCFPENIIDPEHYTSRYTRGGISQEVFCEKMAEIGEGDTSVNVFDSYHYMGINAYNGLFYYPSNDGIHPWNNTKTIGRKIGAWLNSKYCI